MSSPLARLPQAPLRERVADAVRDAIVAGQILPGDKIPEQELATQLGVSRVPVREAIRILEQQGLLTTRPRSGTFVVKPTMEELENAVRLRAALEELAFHQAFERLSAPEWDGLCNRLQALIDELRESDAQRKGWRVNSLDMQLHATLVDAARNSLLSQFWRNLGVSVWLITYRRITAGHSIAELAQRDETPDHERLLAVLRRRDPVECVHEIREHVLVNLRL